LCYYCKNEVIDKLATYEKEEKLMITGENEAKIQSGNKSVIIQNKNDELVDDLKKKINYLQIENDNKDKIIKDQTNRIKELGKKLINKKIKFKEDKLEDLIQEKELEVHRPKIIQLRNVYEQLIKAKNNSNFIDIKKTEETIEEIKNELLAKKSEGVREIFHKCEKVAKLRFQREQIYEAKIELPTF
jgi:hypothetical protein